MTSPGSAGGPTPLLYLHGLSTGDFVPALEAFFGSGVGLSAPVIPRLVAAWQADYETFCRRDLSDRDYVYCWADRVHFRVRLEQARLCCLVIVGMRADGRKELVASQRRHPPTRPEPGVSGSWTTQGWAVLLDFLKKLTSTSEIRL